MAYADNAQSQMGSAMFRFALGGFPALRAVPPTAGADLKEPTDRVIDERAPGLKGDDSETVNEDVDPAAGDQRPTDETEAGETAAAHDEQDPSNVVLTERETRRIRRLLERWIADTASHSPIVSRLAVTQLLLCAIESGFWESALGEQGWMLPLGNAIKTLNSDDTPERLSNRVASVAAVGIYLMHEHRPISERTADVLRYEEVARETAHLYADADPELIANFAEPFTNKNGYPIDPDAVMHVISMIVQNDPLAKAIDLLEERCPSWNIHRHKGALLHISSSFRSPFLPAAEALDEVLGIDSVTVWATGRSGDWAVAAREGGTLIRVDKQGHRTTWWHYRLNNLVSATRIAHDQELAIRVRIPHGPLNQGFLEAEKVLDSVGFNPADEPPCACPHMDS